MDVFRAIYTSRPFGFDQAMLSGILMDARHANIRDGITGALICRADIYLQWLEGPEAQVRKALDRIAHDDRHLEVKVPLLSGLLGNGQCCTIRPRPGSGRRPRLPTAPSTGQLQRR